MKERRKVRKGSVTTEAEAGIMFPQAKEWGQPLEGGQGKKQIISYSLQKGENPYQPP